jgi:DNA repair exonuclease SbcCD ATPase subunit
LEALSQKNTELSTQINTQQEEINHQKKEKEELESKLILIGGTSKKLLEEHEKIKKDLEKTQATNEFLTEQSRKNQTEINSLKSEMSQTQTELDKAQQEKDRQQQRASDLEVDNASLRTDLTQEQNQVKALEANLEKRQKLNESLKTQITTLTNERDEALTNHQAEQTAHGKTKIERDNYKSKMDNHICSVSCQEPCCLGDYEKLQKKLATQKNKILAKIDNSLELGLTGQITLPNLIKKIKELINKPPVIDDKKVQELENELTKARRTISQLEEQIRNSYSSGEKLAVVIKLDLQHLEKLFRHQLDPQVRQKIEKAQNYQELVQVRGEFIRCQTQKNLADLSAIQREKTNLIKWQKIERVITISLLVASLLIVGGLLAKLRTSSSKSKK